MPRKAWFWLYGHCYLEPWSSQEGPDYLAGEAQMPCPQQSFQTRLRSTEDESCNKALTWSSRRTPGLEPGLESGRAGAPQRSVGVPGTCSGLCVGAQLGGGIENDYFPNCLRPYVTCNVEQLFPRNPL